MSRPVFEEERVSAVRRRDGRYSVTVKFVGYDERKLRDLTAALRTVGRFALARRISEAVDEATGQE